MGSENIRASRLTLMFAVSLATCAVAHTKIAGDKVGSRLQRRRFLTKLLCSRSSRE